jgi:UrcA family protein
MFRHFVSVLLPLAALVSVTASAAEVNTPDSVSVEVSYAGLDLSSAAGAAAFRARIKQAINEICGWSDVRDQAGMRRLHACRSQLADRVEPRLVAQIQSVQDHQLTAAIDLPAH